MTNTWLLLEHSPSLVSKSPARAWPFMIPSRTAGSMRGSFHGDRLHEGRFHGDRLHEVRFCEGRSHRLEGLGGNRSLGFGVPLDLSLAHALICGQIFPSLSLSLSLSVSLCLCLSLCPPPAQHLPLTQKTLSHPGITPPTRPWSVATAGGFALPCSLALEKGRADTFPVQVSECPDFPGTGACKRR